MRSYNSSDKSTRLVLHSQTDESAFYEASSTPTCHKNYPLPQSGQTPEGHCQPHMGLLQQEDSG